MLLGERSLRPAGRIDAFLFIGIIRLHVIAQPDAWVAQKETLLSGTLRQNAPPFMESNLNLWGIFVVPIGVLLCFGPALVVWIFAEGRKEPTEESKPRKQF
jgi:hypothetical protein